MKITILSELDYAGSGRKLYKALKDGLDIQMFAGRYHNPFSHPELPHKTKREIQKRVNESDIIHLKGDFPPKDVYMGIAIRDKPIIVSVSGSHFRKKAYGGYGKYTTDQYDRATVKTAFTPDLMYTGFDIWTPHPIDSKKRPITWKRATHPVLMHTPSNRDRKDTAFFEAVSEKLHKRLKIETIILENMPFKRIQEYRKEATIFFDQFKVGFYGNSAIEAMQYGIPVASWISPLAFDQSQGQLEQCPVLTTVKKVDLWAEMIEKAIDGDLETLSLRTKQWCDNIHSYQTVSKQWQKIYNAVSMEI